MIEVPLLHFSLKQRHFVTSRGRARRYSGVRIMRISSLVSPGAKRSLPGQRPVAVQPSLAQKSSKPHRAAGGEVQLLEVHLVAGHAPELAHQL